MDDVYSPAVSLTFDFPDPAHKSTLQAYFDAVGVCVGPCKNILHDAGGQAARALILLLDNFYPCAYPDIKPVISIHQMIPSDIFSSL
jgi:hypothetical protein